MLDIFIKNIGITEPELRAELQEHSTITYPKKGELIIKNGTYIKVLTIVLSGKVRVYQESEDKEILIYYLNNMQTCTLSLSACFEDCKSNVNAMTEEDCVILNIPVRFVKDWNFKYKSWNRYTINTFSQSNYILTDKHSNLAFQPLKERLFDYIISNANNNVLKKSHQELAKELGTTREVISRILKTLEKNNRLSLGQKEIVVL